MVVVLTIAAIDEDGESTNSADWVTVTFNVTDYADTVAVKSGASTNGGSFKENQNPAEFELSDKFEDGTGNRDADTLTYVITGQTASGTTGLVAEINGSKIVWTGGSTDNTPMNVVDDTEHIVTVTVTDAEGSSGALEVTFTIEDLVNAPTLVSGSSSSSADIDPGDGVPTAFLTHTLTDYFTDGADNDPLTFGFSATDKSIITRESGGITATIDNTTGVLTFSGTLTATLDLTFPVYAFDEDNQTAPQYSLNIEVA